MKETAAKELGSSVNTWMKLWVVSLGKRAIKFQDTGGRVRMNVCVPTGADLW